MGHHAFTVDEANEMLPEVRVTLDELSGWVGWMTRPAMKIRR